MFVFSTYFSRLTAHKQKGSEKHSGKKKDIYIYIYHTVKYIKGKGYGQGFCSSICSYFC